MRQYVFVVLCLAALGFGQCNSPEAKVQRLDGMGRVVSVPFAKVRVCAVGDTASPCTPVTIYADAGLSIPTANPLTADKFGQYRYCAASGVYNEQISGAGIKGLNNQPVTIGNGGGGELASGAVDVRSHGAKCDGVTDDTSAIQAAINAANATSKALAFPFGATCLLASASGTVTLPGDDGTTAVGRTCGGGACTTLSPETPVTMPYSIAIPNSMEVLGNNVTLKGTFNYGTDTPSPSQRILVYLNTSGESHVNLHDLVMTNAFIGIYTPYVSLSTLRNLRAGAVGFPLLANKFDRVSVTDVTCDTTAACITLAGWWMTRNSQTDESGGFVDKSEFVRIANTARSQPYDAYAQSFDTFYDTYFWKSGNEATRGTDALSGYSTPTFYGVFGTTVLINARKQRASNNTTIHQVMHSQACREAVIMLPANNGLIEQVDVEGSGYAAWSGWAGSTPMADPYNGGNKIPAWVISNSSLLHGLQGTGVAVANAIAQIGQNVQAAGADTTNDVLVVAPSKRVLHNTNQNETFELGFGHDKNYQGLGWKYYDSTGEAAQRKLCLRANNADTMCADGTGAITFAAPLADVLTSAKALTAAQQTWSYNDTGCANVQSCTPATRTTFTAAAPAIVTRISGTVGTQQNCTGQAGKVNISDGTHTYSASFVNASSSFDSGALWGVLNAGTITLTYSNGGGCTLQAAQPNTTIAYRDTATAAGSADKAICWKDATTLGYCSTQPDAAGACTCN